MPNAFIYRNNIIWRAQEAYKLFLQAQPLQFLTSGEIARETVNDPKHVPICVVVCNEAEYYAEAARAGNWICKMALRIETQASDETGQDHESRCGEIWDLILTDDAVGVINNFVATNSAGFTDFTAFNIRPTGQYNIINGNKWVAHLMFELECCGSTLG